MSFKSLTLILSAVTATAIPLGTLAGDAPTDLGTVRTKYNRIRPTSAPSSDVPITTGVLQEVESKLNDVGSYISTAVTNSYGYVEPLYTTVSQEANDVVNSTKVYAESAVTQASGAVRGVVSKVNDAAYTAKTFVVHTTTEAEGFFASTFHTVKNWFFNLEQEVKEFLHFALRAIEVAVVVVILFVFIWILRRVTSGYKFLKSVAGTFELQDRTTV